MEINQEPYTIVGVIRQDENYQPTINSIDEYYTYYQSIVGSVMIPDSCWPISFKFECSSECNCESRQHRYHEFGGKCSSRCAE